MRNLDDQLPVAEHSPSPSKSLNLPLIRVKLIALQATWISVGMQSHTDTFNHRAMITFPVIIMQHVGFAPQMHTIISMEPSISLEGLAQKALEALRPSILEYKPDVKRDKVSVARMEACWAGSHNGPFPRGTHIIEMNLAATLTYMASSRGYNCIKIVVNQI